MKRQHGGTFLGFVLGLVVGLAIALVVAVYVTKVPVPFLERGDNRSTEQDAAESKKNQNWDPNAPLYGKNPARAASAADPGTTPATSTGGIGQPQAKPAVSADPLGDLLKAREADPFVYYVQAGAFRTAEDAESQRARLSLVGFEAKVSERDQAGRVVYRVRLGPLQTREEADQMRIKLVAAGVEAAMVRVQR